MPKAGKRPIKDAENLTDKQRAFISNLTDTNASTFADVVKSMIAAGYKHGREPRVTAINLLANKNILSGLLSNVQAISRTCLIRQETAKERIWQELELCLSDCKTSADMTNRIRVIELMGKFHQLWSDKTTVNIIETRELSDERRSFLRRIASTIVMESCLLPAGDGIISPGPLQDGIIGDKPLPEVEPTIDIETQDVVGVCDDAQTITDDDTVSRDTIDYNDSNGNGL